MDAKRYAELFTDVGRWSQQARRLKIAADELYEPAFDRSAIVVEVLQEKKAR